LPIAEEWPGQDAGAVRASIGLGTRTRDVEVLLRALESLMSDGPRSDYALVDGYMEPDPDPRPTAGSGAFTFA